MEKKEEVGRGWWVDVSLGFLIGWCIPQIVMFLASSNAELSLTPRYAEVAVTLLCPSNLLTTGVIKIDV